jgi:hypothetical protein
MAIKLPFNPDFSETASRYPCGDQEYHCVICGKPVKMASRPWCLRIINGGFDVATIETEEQIDPAGDLYWLPIGNNCLRKHPELKPWAKR